MPTRESPMQSEILQGTLDMLVLKTLVIGPACHTIAHAIGRGSDAVLQIDYGWAVEHGGAAAYRQRAAVVGIPAAFVLHRGLQRSFGGRWVDGRSAIITFATAAGKADVAVVAVIFHGADRSTPRRCVTCARRAVPARTSCQTAAERLPSAASLAGRPVAPGAATQSTPPTRQRRW
jgi:hypothetical protein